MLAFPAAYQARYATREELLGALDGPPHGFLGTGCHTTLTAAFSRFYDLSRPLFACCQALDVRSYAPHSSRLRAARGMGHGNTVHGAVHRYNSDVLGVSHIRLEKIPRTLNR